MREAVTKPSNAPVVRENLFIATWRRKNWDEKLIGLMVVDTELFPIHAAYRREHLDGVAPKKIVYISAMMKHLFV